MRAERQASGAWAGVRQDAPPHSHTQIQPRAPRRTRGWWLVVRWMVCVLTSSKVEARGACRGRTRPGSAEFATHKDRTDEAEGQEDVTVSWLIFTMVELLMPRKTLPLRTATDWAPAGAVLSAAHVVPSRLRCTPVVVRA